LVIALACAGAAGCGGSDDDGGSSSAGSAPSQTTTGGDASGGNSSGGNGAPAGSSDDSARAGEDGRPAPTLLGDRGEAQAGAATVDDVYDDLAAAASAGVASPDVPVTDTLEAADGNEGLTRFCDLMTAEAQRQTVVYAERSAGLADVEWTCERGMALLLRRAEQHGGLKRSVEATVVGVNAVGNRATATVRFGGPKGRLSTLSLVKQGDQWKLAATPTGEE
jgi:hypothetical protein